MSGRQAWYLHAGGGLSPVEPSGGVASRYRYDPADPTPVRGGPSTSRKPRVGQNEVEARADVLTFTTDELSAPLEVTGPVAATVHLRSSVDHTDVVVRLCDVDRRGRSVNVCDGIRRVTPAEHPADNGGVRRVDIALCPRRTASEAAIASASRSPAPPSPDSRPIREPATHPAAPPASSPQSSRCSINPSTPATSSSR
jgi:putative CocE/NonD family hydrolase